MTLNLHLSRRIRLLLLGVAGVALVAIAIPMLLRREPTADALRSADIISLEKLLEAYERQHGAYPEPAAAAETAEGIRHVWGYRKGKAALASCTVVCGGDIYDAEGRVIGWKGTIALESALNSVDVAGNGGRLSAPLSDFTEAVPLDPGYAADQALAARGFGEYVYAVRAPEDGAEGRGGIQYELATTMTDPATGVRFTLIRGNYFVPSSERGRLPPSLIGPGLLSDSHHDPEPGEPLHVLLDSQREGYPNPEIGEGEQVLRLLALQTKARNLERVLESRRALIAEFPSSQARDALAAELVKLGSSLDPLLAALDGSSPSSEEGGTASERTAADLDHLDAKLRVVAADLEKALEGFTVAKAGEVQEILRLESEQRGTILGVLSGALLALEEAQGSVLLARDELVKYLDGEGIEEQSRSRAGRKIEQALESAPDLPELFREQALLFPSPFLSEDLQAKVESLPSPGRTGTGTTPTDEKSEGGAVMATTVTAEIALLSLDLRHLLEETELDLGNLAVTVSDIDESLRRLAQALEAEMTRMHDLFKELAPAEAALEQLTRFEALVAEGGHVSAMRQAARGAKQHADFSPFLFSPATLESVVLERKAGIPDITAHADPTEAEYRGIPYPLP